MSSNHSKVKITKAIIPAAGYGTRFLPQTKAMPKEMLPIIDKPVIQYVVEEVVEAGITDCVIVTGWLKRTIEDHFDHNFELEQVLKLAGKHDRLKKVQEIAQMANFIYIRQKGPIGNATPILNAKHIVGNQPFLVLWGDDFILAKPSRSQQLIEAYKKFPGQMLSAIRTKREEDTKRYAYVKGETVAPGIVKIKEIIEKPGPVRAKKLQDLAIVSGYLYTADIFGAIEKIGKPRQGEELMYTDALNILLKEGKPVYAVEIKNGRYYDCGNILEYLETVVEFGLKHEAVNGEFRNYLKELKL